VTTFADGKIEAYLGPKELKAKDNLETVIVDFIAGAKRSLDIAVQELDSESIAQAILDARWRGIDVELFLEQDYRRSDLRGTPPHQPTPKPGETPAQALFRARSRMTASSLKTAASSPPSCAQTCRCVATTTRPSSTRSSFSGTIARERRFRARRPLWLGQLHAHGYAPQPEPRLRLPQCLRLSPVRDRGRAATPREFWPRDAWRGAQDL
jgi:hypothetical protein